MQAGIACRALWKGLCLFCGFLYSAARTRGLCRFCILLLRLFNAYRKSVDRDSSAVFADDYFLVHLYFEATLRRDAVEATSARSALHSYDSETVVGILADSLESGEGVGSQSAARVPLPVRGCSPLPGASRRRFLQVRVACLPGYAHCRQVPPLQRRCRPFLSLLESASRMFFSASSISRLSNSFSFFEESVFAVVAHVAYLLVIFLYLDLTVGYFSVLPVDESLQFGDFLLKVLYACPETDYFRPQGLSLRGEVRRGGSLSGLSPKGVSDIEKRLQAFFDAAFFFCFFSVVAIWLVFCFSLNLFYRV